MAVWAQRILNKAAHAAVCRPLVLFAACCCVLTAEVSSNSCCADEAPTTEPASASAALSDADIIAMVNQQLRAAWSDAKIAPSAEASEGEWCRRVYLDLVGRIPSVDELEAFLADRSADKKAKLVDRLLDDEAYTDDYARHWTTIWTNLLIGRTAGLNRRDLVNREGMQHFLRRAFQTNKSYDQIVFDLISANGSNKPGEEAYNGAVNFLLDKLQDNATTATAKTAQLFLGLQVQCTQCHNHPFNEWKQDQFWNLNAFFRQAKPLRTFQGRDIESVRLEDEDFPGESGRNPAEAETFYELRSGEMAAAWPTFVDGQRINPSGFLEDVNRRDELARLVTTSEYLAPAIVNRTWSHFFGYGFTKPVDDMGPHNPPSHPELLDQLARQFAYSGHDLKRLMRWITLSEAYGLSSRMTPKNKSDDPALGEPPLFSHFYLRQMRAEELYESLLVATEADKTRGAYEDQERVKADWLQQFSTAFGTDEGDEATTFNGTIPQTLMMMNGELVESATSVAPGSFLYRIAADPKLAPAAKISRLYLAALARRPTSAEVRVANQLLAERGGNAAAALQDIWWALLNSNEFILNH